jgi:uncharacterized membrane protein
VKEFFLYLGTAAVFFSLDMLWLGVVAKNYYFKNLPHLRAQPNWTAAIIFYLIYVVGIIVFAILPYRGDLFRTMLFGGMFGFFAYATYDLTNLSVTKNWPLKLSLIDIAWGTFLTGVVSGAGFFIANWIFV